MARKGKKKKKECCFQYTQINFHFPRTTFDHIHSVMGWRGCSILPFIPIYCNLISPLFVFIMDVCGYSQSHHIFSWVARYLYHVLTPYHVPWPFMTMEKVRKWWAAICDPIQDKKYLHVTALNLMTSCLAHGQPNIIALIIITCSQWRQTKKKKNNPQTGPQRQRIL